MHVTGPIPICGCSPSAQLNRVADRPSIAHLTNSADFCLVQVNVVVMRGVNDDEIADFVELTRDRSINVRFIEYMPFDGNVWSDTKMVTYKQMMAAVQQRFPHELQRLQVWFLLMFGGCNSWQVLSVSLS